MITLNTTIPYGYFVENLRSNEKNLITQLPFTSAKSVWLLTAAYLLFVLKFGPDFMRNRKPYKLKRILALYNIFQVVFNAAIFFIGVALLIVWKPFEDLGCVKALTAQHPLKSTEVVLFYLFYVMRLVDFLDTVFFVLRKNYRQVTFLHVSHHVIVNLVGNLYMQLYGSGGHVMSYGMLNTLTHAVMYAYYYISAERPDSRYKDLLKPNITRIQLLQFMLIFLHSTYPFIFRPTCEFPKFWLYLSQAESAFFLVLFSRFYVRTYRKSKSAAETSKRPMKKLN